MPENEENSILFKFQVFLQYFDIHLNKYQKHKRKIINGTYSQNSLVLFIFKAARP